MITLTVISETKATLTVGWTPITGSRGYAFYVDGKRVSNTWDASVRQVKFGKPDAGVHTYEVVALTMLDQGSLQWPAVTPPVPGTALKGMYVSGSVAPVWPTIQKTTGCNMVIGGADDTTGLAGLRATGGKLWGKAGYWDDAAGSFSMSDAQALALAQNVAKNWPDVVAGWYVADEPTNNPANRAAIQKRAELLKSGFAVETVMAYYDAGSLAQWKGIVDAFALDVYPSHDNWNMALITQLAAAADAAGLRYYGVPGAFAASGYLTPTKAQLAEMIQLWKATKAAGLVFYAWNPGGSPQLSSDTDWQSAVNAA